MIVKSIAGLFVVALASIAIITLFADKSAHSPTVLYSDMEDFLALDPVQVEKANPLLAPDRTSASLFAVTEHLRDNLQQLLGQLNGRIADEDCDGIKRIAFGLDKEQVQFEAVKAQYDTLEDDDQRAVAQYVQERLTPVAAELEGKIVTHLLQCEGSTTHYESVVGPITVIESKATDFTNDMKDAVKQDKKKGCGVMEEKFSEFTQLLTELYNGADEKLQAMRAHGYIIAEEKADLELESRIEPIERQFFAQYDKLWTDNCAKVIEGKLGKAGGKAGGKDSGSASK